jgi:tetratricopeptide (TPR) repeat protein
MRRQLEAKQHVDRGGQFILEGRYGQAETELRTAIEINPFNATAHANMGDVFSRQGRYTEAIPWFEKALELNPLIDGVPEALARARAAAKNEPYERTVGNYQKAGAWIGPLLLAPTFLVIACLQPIDGVPGYQLITREDFSIIFGFAFSFLVGGLVGVLLGSWLGIRVGKKKAAKLRQAGQGSP